MWAPKVRFSEVCAIKLEEEVVNACWLAGAKAATAGAKAASLVPPIRAGSTGQPIPFPEHSPL